MTGGRGAKEASVGVWKSMQGQGSGRGLWQRRARSTWLVLVVGLVMAITSTHAHASPADSFRAGRAAKGASARRAHFQAGIDSARALINADSKSSEGIFWLAVNMGAEALERGKMSALPVVPKMERLLLTLDQLDPKYEDAGAARVLGRLYHQAPAVISVGSSTNAKKFLERALQLAPHHPGNQAFAADFLLQKGDEQRAKKLAAACLQTLKSAGARYGEEGKEWAKIAQDVIDD